MPEYAFETPHPVDLYVEIGKGQVTVTCTDPAASGGHSTAQVHGARADDVVVEQEGDELRVVEPRRSGGLLRDSSLHVAVGVPAGSDLTIRTGSADVDVTGSAGSAHLRTGSGDLVVDVVDGPLQVETGSGDLTVRETGGPTRVKSGSGDVDLGLVRGEETSVSTGSGDVGVRRLAGSTTVKTGSGDLRVRETQADLTASSGSGDVVVDRADRGRITAKGASGDVRVGVRVGLPVWTDMLTVTGTVRTDVEPTGAPVAGQDHVELRVTSVSGDVTLSNC